MKFSSYDGRNKFISIIFVATAMIMLAKILFGCNALVIDLPYGLILFEEELVFYVQFYRTT